MSEDANTITRDRSELKSKLTRSEVSRQVESGEYETEDLAAVFFNRYGHKLNSVINGMSHKQIRRAIINTFGFRHKSFNPKPESNEGMLYWAMTKLVESMTTMYLSKLQKDEFSKMEAEFEKNSGLEDKLIAMETNKTETLSQEGNTDGQNKEA